jgi:hypothetical protein
MMTGAQVETPAPTIVRPVVGVVPSIAPVAPSTWWTVVDGSPLLLRKTQ